MYLAHQITPAQAQAWRAGRPIDWANESHAVAVKVIYGELPHDEGALPAAYGRVALPVVNQQIERAGVRLAMALNIALTR